jgi:hypothetical protein
MSDSVLRSAGDRFVVVGLVTGIGADDGQYFQDNPQQEERFRCVSAQELEIEPTATHCYVYAGRDFDGHFTGQRHRMLLRRVERPR